MVTANSRNGISKVWVRFSRSTGSQVEEGGTESLVDYVHIFPWKGNEENYLQGHKTSAAVT